MKFRNLVSAQLFCTEIRRFDLLEKVTVSFVPEQDLIELFLKRRQELIPRLRDFRKAQAAAMGWRRHRDSLMKGIKQFHGSTTGKRFHRELGRFLALRITRGAERIQRDKQLSGSPLASLSHEHEGLTIYESGSALKALTSAKTHLFIDLEYFMSMDEEVDYTMFIEYVHPLITSVEQKILSHQGEFTDEELDILFRLTDEGDLIKSLAEKSGDSIPQALRFWEDAKRKIKKEKVSEEDQFFFTQVAVAYAKRSGLRKAS